MGAALSKKTVAEMKATSEGKSFQDVSDQVQKELAVLNSTTLHIAITGVTGAGKSSLVNALRGVEDDEEGAAKTGVVQTTMVPKSYTHPKFSNVVIWDLPGIGTQDFKPDTYLKSVNFSQYDFFIIVSRDCFTEHDANLAREIEKMKKKFYFVHTQIDCRLHSERRKPDFNEKATLEQIGNYCCENLRKAGVSTPKVLLISSWCPEMYDFPLLQEALEDDLNDLKKQVLIMAMPAYSKEAFEKKKAVMERRILNLALTSCVLGAIPIPGFSIYCDIAILVSATKEICHVFGLDEGSLQKLAERIGQPVSELKSVIKYTPLAGDIKAEFVLNLLAKSALCTTSTMLELVLDVIPVIGSLTGAGLSFVTTHYLLRSFLNDVVKDAENVLAKVAALSKKKT